MVDHFRAEGIQKTHANPSNIHQAQQANAAARFAIIQESKAENFQEWSESLNPAANAVRQFDTLEAKVKRKPKEEDPQKAEKAEKAESEDIQIESIGQIAQQFEEKNPELHSKNLMLLRGRISVKDSAEDILKKVLQSYPDVSLADEALDFLEATTSGELAEKVRDCKEKFNEISGREIRAGRNINVQARQFSESGLGSPTGLRDLYRDMTGNPRDPATLFEELSTKYPFEKMKTVIAFVLHSLGADLKSKGPSISRGELHRLMSETKSLQAILGVYRFFQSRMKLISSAFERQGLTTTTRVTFEMLAKLFVKFLLERYPSADKVVQLGVQMGISDEIIAEVIIFTQMRDGVRQVAPRLFRNDQHRQDILIAFIEALEDLEDQLEDGEEDDE
jgi:type III secretion protein W